MFSHRNAFEPRSPCIGKPVRRNVLHRNVPDPVIAVTGRHCDRMIRFILARWHRRQPSGRWKARSYRPLSSTLPIFRGLRVLTPHTMMGKIWVRSFSTTNATQGFKRSSRNWRLNIALRLIIRTRILPNRLALACEKNSGFELAQCLQGTKWEKRSHFNYIWTRM